MKAARLLSLAFLGLVSTACFHQVVQTGRTPSTTVIDRPWVNTWIFGLVEAQPIDVRAQCPDGVATVTTEQSFANGLVGAVTLGIYTPVHVTVACAARGAMLDARTEIHVASHATAAERERAFSDALARSIATRGTVVVRY